MTCGQATVAWDSVSNSSPKPRAPMVAPSVRSLAALLFLSLAPALAAAQNPPPVPPVEQAVPLGPTHHDLIRGTITSDSGKAIPDAEVIITRAPDRLSLTTKTDVAGHYTMEWAEGTGDYLVHISAVSGYVTFRKRVYTHRHRFHLRGRCQARSQY